MSVHRQHAVSRAVPKVMAKAMLVLGVAFAATVFVTVVISPGIVDALQALGAGGARLDKVTIRTLELVAIAFTVIALMLFGGGGKAAWGVPRRRGLARRGAVVALLRYRSARYQTAWYRPLG